MPRVIDFGAPYGTREFPDSATDEEIAAEYDRVRSLPENQPSADQYLQQAIGGVVRGAAREVAALPKAVGIIGGELRRGVGYVPGLDFPTREGEEFSTAPEASEAYKLGQFIERGGAALAPEPVPGLEESFLATKVPEAVGSGLGFLTGGGVARLLRRGVTGATARAAERELAEVAAVKGAPLATKALAAVSEGAEIATLGATSQFQNEYDKAIQSGADRDTALKAGLLGLPIGASEAVPLSNMLRRLDRFSGGGFTRTLITAGKEAFEESLQEAAQTFASNAVEKGLYNEAKSLTDDLLPQAGAGGAAGFLLSTLTQALGAGARRLRKGAPDAETTRTTAETTGGETQGVVEGSEERLRLRGAPQDRVATGARTSAETIQEALKPYGVTLSPRLTIFDDPSPTAPAARTQFGEGNVFQRIELNQAKLPTAKEVQDKFEHEVAHVGSDSGALSEPLNLLTPQERGDIALEMSRLGYAQGSQNEFDARGTQALVSAWQNRTWFGQLVGRVTAWANETLGIKLTRRAAEAIAVRAVGRSIERLRQPSPATELTGATRTETAEEPPPPSFAARFNPETLMQRPAWVEPGSAFDKVLGELREKNDPMVGRDVTGIWSSLTPAQRQDLMARGWNVTTTRQLNQVVMNISNDVPPARRYYSMMARRRRERTEEAKAEPVAPPPVQGVQVAGAAAQLGRVAEEAYRKREAAGTQLEGLAYERQQYKAARQELRRLTEMATGRLFQEGLSIEDNPEFFPDPNEGVGIVDGQVVVGDEFLNKLSAGGENPNPANTKALQGEVYFEKEAHRLVNLRGQIDLLQRAMTYYAALGVEQSEIDKIQETINKLSTAATALSEAQWNGKTIGERVDEIEAAESKRPGLLAQRSSLGLGPVAEFFGRQVGGFREFIAKVEQGLRLAAALRDKATTPEELRAAVEALTGWVALPEEVRDAVMSGRGLTDEQRGAAFASLASAFEDFNIQRQQMGALRDSRNIELNRRAKELVDAIATGKIEEGMAEVLIADVLAALDGESGGTGTLQSQATAQELKNRITAIKAFALNLGKNIETNGALFEWITNPQGPTPGANATALGLDQGTLDLILSEIKKNPAFGSAVVTLINSADAKLAKLPIVQLENITELLNQGEPGAANAAAQKMISSAKSRASLAATSQRKNIRELEAVDIERQSLDEGVGMFNELAASPEFNQLRDAVSNSPYGLVEPMDVANNVSRTLRPFGGKGIPSHPGVKLDAADSPALKSEDFVRVHRWNKAAQEHLDAYDAAAALHAADPANNPSPAALGFDLPVIRGLRDAVQRSVPGSAQVLSTQDKKSRWKVPWLVRLLNRTSWFRQHDFVTKMVGGSTGTDLRSKLGDWVNHFLIARSVSQKYRDIPDLRHKAMKSHPEVQMNQALYRTFWNELAHWGRIFGSPLRVGFVLPGSGRAVTAEDLALLKRETEFEEDLRRRVTETRPVAGVRIKKGNREFVRAGAFVGDRGLPRHLGGRATSFIADVLAAYGDTGAFGINSDLSISSTDPVVAFWNQRPKMMVQHVLDSTRQDRAMRMDPLMAQAERTAAADWMANGVPTISSVEELVNELVKHFPPAPGINVREKVVAGLNEELRQYRDAANRINSERKTRDDERNSKVQIAFSADNEFTRPAAQLELPSELYDYGALTDTDHILIQSRANHERVVAYSTALQRAIGDLANRIRRFRDSEVTEKEAFHGGTIREAEDILGLLRKLYDDFDSAYKMGSPALTQGGWFREASGLLTSAVLALPTVNLRNMTQGQFEVYTMSQAMGLGGQRLMMWQALKNMPRTLVRYALHIGSGIAKRTDLGAAFLTGKNMKIFEGLVQSFADIIGQGDFRASADRIHELGFDTRDGFLERMRRLWQESAESAQVEDLGKAKVFGRQVAKLAGIPHSALRALFDTIGVQESDLTINAALLTYGTMLEKRLQEVAKNYGAERERQGLTNFDPTNPAWKLKPSEWAAFGNEQANRDSLALFELFMEQSASAEGFQLEKSLWEYYQRSKAGPTRLFTERQFDAMSRGLLAQFNASTPANRSSAAAGNNVIRNLLTLQGYVSDGLLKLINASMGGSRDRKAIAGIMAKLPTLAGLALMSILIGYMVGAITGEWEKRVRGRAPSLPTPLDGDFYTSWKRWGEGTARLSLAQLFYIGDLALALRGEVQGNRGFDPVGRVFPLSVIQRALNSLRGAIVADPESSLGQTLRPFSDMGQSIIPWAVELQRVFGSTVPVTKQSERIGRGEAQLQDLLPERRGQAFGGPSYGPTTIIRRDLMDAVSRYWQRQQAGDATGAAAALESAKAELAKLERSYTAKYIAANDTPERAAVKARQDLWRDYQELNPVVSAMLGKRPTRAEFDLIRGGITGERRTVFDNGIAAWQSGAQALFGRAAPVTREDVAASRVSSGGGRGGGASVIPRGGLGGGGLGLRPLLRPVGGGGGALRLPRARLARRGGGRTRGPRLARRTRLRRAGPRIRTVRVRTSPQRFRIPNRRRRRQAVAA